MSSENIDMECPIGADTMPALSPSSGRQDSAEKGTPAAETELRCVWTGDPVNGCSCSSSIPEDVVTAAWSRELARLGVVADRFFRFTWQDDVWLAYGLVDGRVRGVHCPPHRAEREQRAVASSRTDERVDTFALYA
jgi:hypothetical protein